MKKSGRYLLLTAFTLGTLALGTVSVVTTTAAPVLAAGWSYPVAVVKGQAALLLNSDGGDLRQERSLPAKRPIKVRPTTRSAIPAGYWLIRLLDQVLVTFRRLNQSLTSTMQPH